MADELPRKPGNVPGGELLCVRNGTSVRDGYPRRTIGAQAQNVSPRAAVSPENQTHRTTGDLQRILADGSRSCGAKNEFKLHDASETQKLISSK
jgi:hypothetical protein